jgi:hypothetical protein
MSSVVIHLLLSCSGGNYLADGTPVLVGGDAYAGPGYRSGVFGVRLLKAPNTTDWFAGANFTMPHEVQLKAPRWYGSAFDTLVSFQQGSISRFRGSSQVLTVLAAAHL